MRRAMNGRRSPSWSNRAQFLAAAAEAMRRILIENARRRRAVRHGGALHKVSASATGFDLPASDLNVHLQFFTRPYPSRDEVRLFTI